MCIRDRSVGGARIAWSVIPILAVSMELAGALGNVTANLVGAACCVIKVNMQPSFCLSYFVIVNICCSLLRSCLQGSNRLYKNVTVTSCRLIQAHGDFEKKIFLPEAVSL